MAKANGDTPLHVAAFHGYLAFVTLLVKKSEVMLTSDTFFYPHARTFQLNC